MEALMNLNFTNIWWAIGVPLILMALDIITGYYNAWKDNSVSSSKMRNGLGKKCAELCYIIIRIFIQICIWNRYSNVLYGYICMLYGDSFVV